MWATESTSRAPAVRAPPAPLKPRSSAVSIAAPPSMSAPTAAASATVPRAAAVNLAVTNTTSTAAPARTPGPMANNPNLPQLYNPHSAALADAKAAAAMFRTSGGAKGEFAARKAQPRGRAEFEQERPSVPRSSAVPSPSFSFSRPPPAAPVRIAPAPSAPRRDDDFVQQALAKMLAQDKNQHAAPEPTADTDQSSLTSKKHGRQEENLTAVAGRAADMAVQENTKESLAKQETSPNLPPHKRVKGADAVAGLSKAAEARVPSPSKLVSPVAPPKNWGQTMESFKKNLLDKATTANGTSSASAPPLSAQYDTARATVNAIIAPVDPSNSEHKTAAVKAERALAAQMKEAAERQVEITSNAVLQQSEKKHTSQPNVAKMSEAEYGSKAAKLLIEKERIKKEREKLDQAEEDINSRLEALTKTFLGV
ncbi:hypothetical protein CBER1_04168 [Cercospora berteroae]|uniref:Uncharacterized protein n=1 Tax=Cercospora berteroae TaxID=357750 RepID=A0A2S6CN64_9PEZI|nr:hypothetical protein CBER1_04168 [Cercospora berteroae]